MKKPVHTSPNRVFTLRVFVLAMLVLLSAAFLFVWIWLYLQLLFIRRNASLN